MSFFKEFKADLSQAVNEMMQDENGMPASEIVLEEQIPEGKLDGQNTTDEMMVQEDSSFTEESEAVEEEEVQEPLTEEVPEEITESDTALEEPVEEEIGTPSEWMQSQEISEPEAAEEAAPEAETVFVPEEVTDYEFEDMQTVMNEAVYEIDDNEGEAEMDMYEEIDMDNEEATDENAMITQGMVIRGDISTKGSIELMGSVIGNIEAKGKITITGSIEGNSKANEIFADSARIIGEIKSEGSVKIGQSSVIVGNVLATSAVIAGAVKGDVDVHGPVVIDTSAVVMGNIKSKSVQINNGAVIEGFCSQCYADIDPKTVFDFDEAIKKK